ncbi:MAG: carboxyvinyl-carboxyphosphonate phosphorylmutase [Halomonadaceae bacterium]|nr:carboxyvinyl-carboxyphosphonate phosphorylmutase [Halomonadaceae bacterium]
MRNTQKLRDLVARRNAMTVPGAANGMFARVIEDLGFDAVYVTGAGIANMRLGVPDVGLTTVTEVAETVSNIADAVNLPLIVDADTGFGNAVNMVRTVRLLERAGASAIQIEDQVFPKKCGHFNGKEVIPADEMVQKIRAAVDTRIDQDLMIIARTDARSIDGLDAALDRASAFIEAGADMTFVEAPQSVHELARIGHELSVPQVANIVFGGKTPDPGREALAEYGFSIVLYANATLQAALHASSRVLTALRDEGNLDSVADLLASFDERQRTVNKDFWDGLETRYTQSN